MGDDIVKNIKIKYSNVGMEVMTRQVQNYNAQLKQMTITTQQMNAHGAWKNLSVQTNMGVTQTSKLGGALNGAMMRFIGLNAAISMGQKAFQELKKWVDESVVSFRAFEYRMAEVSSILDSTTRDTLPSLEVGITQLSVRFGKSVNDLTKGLYEIVSAAFDVDDAMNLLNVVTKASIAGLTTVEGAVKTFTGVLNSYGLSAAHAAELSDQMFEAVIRGNFTFKDLESSLGYVTPIAANLGVSFTEVAAALATATRQGQHIDSVTRGLGLLMQGIVNPTNEAAEAAVKYGIDMSATALRIGGLTGFFNQLSIATQRYGAQILPELIGNMRSLRVAMALTGKTGIEGFTEDMELLETATGKTDAALAAMMNTQQTMADILSQSMEQVNRKIGESWSGVDIWWKKTELWWKTLLSGGDAGEAVASFDSAVSAIRMSYIKNIVEPAKTGEKTVFEKLFKSKKGTTGSDQFKDMIRNAIDFNSIKKYLDVSDQVESMNKESTAITNAKIALEELNYIASQQPDVGAGSAWSWKKKTTGADPALIALANKGLQEAGIATLNETATVEELNIALTELNSRLETVTGTLEVLVNTESELRPKIDQVISAFEDASAEIEDHKTNIISLESEISKLNEQVSDMYNGFKGKLRWELEVDIQENKLDQFQESAQMAAKYGEQYINEYTDVFDQYGNSMADVIQTIYEYTDALADEKKAQEEATAAAHELEVQMQINNLQMLKIQLAGMMRRRGNTRAEQRMLKQLEIENTKIRIQEMQNQVDAEESGEAEINIKKQTAYENAQQILTDYIAFEQHQLWLLKDTRDEDIQDLKDNIDEQERLLASRTTMLQSEYQALNAMQQLYQDSLVAISSDPELANAYKKLFGVDALTSAKSSYESYLEFVSNNPIPSGVGGGGIGVGGPSSVTNPVTNTVTSLTHGGYRNGQYTFGTIMSSSGKKKWWDSALRMNTELRDLKVGDAVGWQRGTNYIPETGMYRLHRGESVSPAGNNESNTSNNIVVNINNPQIASDYDVAKVAKTLENVVRASLTDKKYGKSKYRMA